MPFDPNSLQHAAIDSPDRSDPISLDDPSTSVPRASARSPDSVRARVVEPQALKHPSLLANIRKTWTGSGASTPLQGHDPSQRSHSSGEWRDGKFASFEGVAGDRRDMDDRDYYAGERERFRAEDEDEAEPKVGDSVLCAKWGYLSARRGGESRRILMIAYKSGAFAMWDCSDLDSWFEIVNLRSLEYALESTLLKKYPRGIGSVVDFVVLEHHTSIAIVTRRPKSSSSHLLLYSLESHRFASSFDVPDTAHSVAANRRFLLVSTANPLALHVLSTESLQPTPFSPILDLVPSPFDGAPVFSLGSGGRFLTYATNRAIPSSRLDRSPAKTGAGLLAHSGLFDAEPGSPSNGASEFFTRGVGSSGGMLMSEAGQVGEQVARKVSEGVMSGVKAIGEVGMNYWMARSTNARPPDQPSRDPKLSKSAPAHSVAGFGRRLSVPGALSRTSPSLEASQSSANGTVIVVDLTRSAPSPRGSRSVRAPPATSSSSLKVIAHFRPYQRPLALLSMSPSSTSVLTASTPSHSFDIFELHPSSPIGISALQSVPSSSDANSGKAWHRYRLQRGYTSARATAASWSRDGRFVAVVTGKGTSHVYAIQPMGGQPELENHFDPKVKNLTDLPPLSINLSTIARVRPSSSSSTFDNDGEESRLSTAFPAFAFVPKVDSFDSSFRPVATFNHDNLGPARASPSAKLLPIQDILVFYPSSATAQLHRLAVSELVGSPSSAVAAASRGDVGKLATTAVSGLTQLMKSRGGFGGVGSAVGGSSPTSDGAVRAGDQKKEWMVNCSAKAEWALTRGEEDEDVTEDFSVAANKLSRLSAVRTRYSACAEIETFSRSPRVLPRSVYGSQQFTFFALPKDYGISTARGVYDFPRARQLEMRSQVVVRQGDSSGLRDPPSLSSEVPFEPASFDQPIRTAMQTVLDQQAILSPGSPKLPAPSFPVGVAAKQGSWRDSIPIRSVGPAAIEGIGRVRQGLGRVKLPNAGDLVDAARRRRSSVAATLIGSSGQAAYSSSISFDDDEAVFADRLSVEEMGSTSTACTSEGEEGRLSKQAIRDEVDEWGWDEPAEGTVGVAEPSPSPIEDALSQPLFDDDFDNFELELSLPPTTSAKPISPPLEIAVELPSTIVSSVPRNLAPPVTILPSEDEAALSAPTSPRPVNPLLEAHKASTPTPLSSSPSSVTSANSSGGGGGGGKKKKRK